MEGAETDIRKAITNLFASDDVMVSEQFSQPNRKVQRRDFAFVNRQLELIEELIQSDIPYPYRVNIFTHLYILIERYRGVGALMEVEHSYNDVRAREDNPKIWAICQTIINKLGTYLDTSMPESEIHYLFQYLMSSRLDASQTTVKGISEHVREVTRYLIRQVTEAPQYKNLHSPELFSSLAKHVQPLLNRLENHIKDNNNLLEQIKMEYPQLFLSVKQASQQLTKHFALQTIDNAEIGFITVYFAQALENSRMPINILLVCTTGLGTAELLKSKIKKRFSGLNIVDTIPVKDLQQTIITHPEVNLVVSTVALFDDVSIPFLVISGMLIIKDQERLERTVDTIREKEML